MSPAPDPLCWPTRLLSPAVLGFVRPSARSLEIVGPLPARPRLALVGSRAAHRHVLRAIPSLLREAMVRGWSLVSGGALGVDGGAHRAALELGMPQLAVLPCGRDTLYPPGHAGLFASMHDSGDAGLVFAHPPGTQPARAMFASRNALIVGLADAVLVAEAGLRSGSRVTGRLALQRRRPLAALAGSPGCGALIGAGALALPAPPRAACPDAHAPLAAALAAWLDRLGQGPELTPADPLGDWPDHLRWLGEQLRASGPAGASLDALADPGRATVALCEAELLGLVCEAGPGRWVALTSE